jgi:hypothetical protein
VFEPSSRYFALETVTIEVAGRVVSYKRRRFLPRGEDMTTLVEITTSEGDRLDLMAARTLGDPEQFWRICDANDAMNPFELAAEPNHVLKIPVPQL